MHLSEDIVFPVGLGLIRLGDIVTECLESVRNPEASRQGFALLLSEAAASLHRRPSEKVWQLLVA